jgi:hypothetical protein
MIKQIQSDEMPLDSYLSYKTPDSLKREAILNWMEKKGDCISVK